MARACLAHDLCTEFLSYEKTDRRPIYMSIYRDIYYSGKPLYLSGDGTLEMDVNSVENSLSDAGRL